MNLIIELFYEVFLIERFISCTLLCAKKKKRAILKILVKKLPSNSIEAYLTDMKNYNWNITFPTIFPRDLSCKNVKFSIFYDEN